MGELAKILPPYNMNQLSLATAKFALQHHDAIQTTIDILKAERERVFSELSAIGRLKAFPSEANFITVRVPDADALFNTLKENRILIKKLHGTHPLLAVPSKTMPYWTLSASFMPDFLKPHRE